MKIIKLHTTELSWALRTELLDLCTAAYEEDFEPIFEEIGPSFHLLGFEQEKLVSHASYIQRDLRTPLRSFRTAFIEAVAVLPELQGNGFGTSIMRSVPEHVNGFELAALSPSDDAFYERFGWELWQGPLSYRDDQGNLVPTPNEDVMIYRLPLTGELDITDSLSCEWRIGDIW